MKKILFLMMFCCSVQTIFAQNQVKYMMSGDSVYTPPTETIALPDSTKLNMNRVYEDVKTGISGLASALKVGSEHVYTVLVKQQLVKSVCGIILLILSAFGVYKLSILSYNLEWEDGPTLWNVLSAIGLIASFIALTASIINIDVIITGIINPEYGAIKDIMEFVNPKPDCTH